MGCGAGRYEGAMSAVWCATVDVEDAWGNCMDFSYMAQRRLEAKKSSR